MAMASDDARDDMDDDGSPSSPAGTQRIDKWLWFARVTKSRTLAAGLVSDGQVRVNRQRVEKASYAVKPGDVLTIGINARVRILEVVAPGVRRGPAPEAQSLYKDLTPPPPPRDEVDTQKGAGEREAGSGRPTKRDRRRIDSFTGNS